MIQIKVNDIFLDLFADEIFALDFIIGDVGRLANRQGNKSVNYKIPASRDNIAALQFVNELDFEGDVNPSKSQPSEILILNTIIDKGIVQILDFNENKKEFEIRYFSGNSLWFQDIKDRNLNDLDLTIHDHIFDKATILASFSNTEGFIYPLIDYGRLTDSAANTVVLSDWFPATFGSTVMRQIFEELGFKIDGSFVDSVFFDKMSLPFSNSKFFKSEEFIDLNTAIVGRLDATGPQLFSPGGAFTTVILDQDIPNANSPNLQDKKNLWDTGTFRYTADLILEVELFITIVASSQMGPADFDLRVLVNGTTTNFTFSGTFSGTPDNVLNISRTGASAIALTPGDFLEIQMRNTDGSGDAFRVEVSQISVTTGERTETIVKVIPRKTIAVGETINLAATLPNMKQTDFLKTIIFQHGLLPITDAFSKTVSFIFFNDIKKNITESVDWSSKLDKSNTEIIKFTELVNNFARVNEVGYKDNTTDFNLVDYLEQTKEVYGSGVIDIDNDFLKDRKSLFTSAFTPTFQASSFINLSTGSLYLPLIKLYEDSSATTTSIDSGFRIGYLLGETDVIDFAFESTSSIDFTGTILTEVPYFFFHKTDFGSFLNSFPFTMSFDQPKDGTAFGDSLLEAHYRDYVKILQAPRFLRAFFDLNQIDILNLDFSKPIFLDQYRSYFYINKVTQFKGDARTTEVELIKLV